MSYESFLSMCLISGCEASILSSTYRDMKYVTRLSFWLRRIGLKHMADGAFQHMSCIQSIHIKYCLTFQQVEVLPSQFNLK